MKKPSFESQILHYVKYVASLKLIFFNFGRYANKGRTEVLKNLKGFYETKCTLIDETDEKKKYMIPSRHIIEHNRLTDSLHSLDVAINTLPRTSLISLSSQFDVYLSGILKNLYLVRPDIINSSDKKMDFSEVLTYGSIDELREYLIEKEIESVLRKSRDEQFSYLENKTGEKFKKFDSYSKFIEISERRNLFVHTDGYISSQYINVCKLHGVQLTEECIIGNQLGIDIKYFSEATNCFIETGVKIAYVLWKKVCKDISDVPDGLINDVCFDLILRKNYVLAINLLEFAISWLGPKEPRTLLKMKFNLAQSYKWSNSSKFQDHLSNIDTLTLENVYKVCKLVLNEEYDLAYKIIKICPEEELSRDDYRVWPMFRELIKENEFLELFKDKFKEDFHHDNTEVVDDSKYKLL